MLVYIVAPFLSYLSSNLCWSHSGHLHIPPIAQCCLVTIVAYVMLSEVGCYTDEKCVGMKDPILWKHTYKTFHMLWTLLATALSEDTFNMITSSGMRYYGLFMAYYMWTFFYGGPSFFWRAGSVNWMRDRLRAAIIMFIFCETVLAGNCGPTMNYIQANAFGTFVLKIVEVSLVLLFLTTQVCTLAFSISGIRIHLCRFGSTTLGCFMIHMYFGFL